MTNETLILEYLKIQNQWYFEIFRFILAIIIIILAYFLGTRNHKK